MEESAFFEMEKMYNELKAEILAESSSEAEDAAEAEDTTDLVATADTAPDKGAVEDKNRVLIRDMTSAQLVALRQNIYLTIASSLSFEEAVHKLLKIKTRDGDEVFFGLWVISKYKFF